MGVWPQTPYFKTPFSLSWGLPVVITHLAGIYAFYLAITGQTHWKTVVFFLGTFIMSGLSVTVCAHRLFTHRTYSANRVLKIVLMSWFNYTGHLSNYDWARIHRAHHKFSDTEADPHNMHRGFFFSQLGWLCLEPTKEFQEKVKTIKVDDLTSDPDVMFQHKYYQTLKFIQWSVAALIPCYFWNENLVYSSCTLCLGFSVLLNHIFVINSFCHRWGWRPYDTSIEPTFYRLGTYLSMGCGYHNFHHAFPFDYSASELKWAQNYNPSTFLIDLFDYFGWISNKRVANPDMIERRREKIGDLKVQMRPQNIVLDYILGFTTQFWTLWLTLGIRYVYCTAL